MEAEARHAQIQREYQQLALDILPLHKQKAVKERFKKAVVLNDTSRLPDNPLTYALVAQKALPGHSVPPAKTQTPRPTATPRATKKSESMDSTTIDRLYTLLDTLVTKVEKMETRLAAIEEPHQAAVTPSNPNVLSAVEKALEALSQQIGILDQKVQKLEHPRPPSFSFAPPADHEFTTTKPGASQLVADTNTKPGHWPIDLPPSQGLPARQTTSPARHRRETKIQQPVKNYFTKRKAPG